MRLTVRDVWRELLIRYEDNIENRLHLVLGRRFAVKNVIAYSLGDVVENWLAGFVTGMVFFVLLPLGCEVLYRIIN